MPGESDEAYLAGLLGCHDRLQRAARSEESIRIFHADVLVD
jgi:hypothetical protein